MGTRVSADTLKEMKNTHKELSVEDVKGLVKQGMAMTKVTFEMKEYTADVNNLLKQGINVTDALNIVGLKTMIDYSAHWQDSFSLYDIEVDEANRAQGIKTRTQNIIDNVSSDLEELLRDINDLFVADLGDEESVAVGGAD